MMLETLTDAPAGTFGLRATGTVIASDVAEALAKDSAASGPAGAKGLIVVIDPDFDGYLAELLRGLEAAAAVPSGFARFVLIAPDCMVSETREHGEARAVKIFPASEKAAAFSYAAGARS